MYDYKKAQKETLKTLKQVDDNVWVMEYKCPYGLDAILEQGTKGIMDAVKFLQKEVKFPHLVPNPENTGFACSTYNAKTPDGDYILGRNFDYKAAPCLVSLRKYLRFKTTSVRMLGLCRACNNSPSMALY